MKRVIIIGGGFAGLSASVYLSESNVEVILLEASPKLGGRAYSLLNEKFNDYYDNGQHILMGCYEETLSFLKKINSIDKLEIQNSLNIPFVRRGGRIFKLETSKNFYPLNLLKGILKYKALTLKERFKIIDFFLDLICCESCDLNNKTVKQWLECKLQTENSIKSFWEILIVGALNTTPDKASAEIFNEVLKRIFFNGNDSARIIIPKTDLTQLYVNDAVQFIQTRNGKLKFSEKVNQIVVDDKKVIAISTDKSYYDDFDVVVFAIPPHAIEKVIINSNIGIQLPTFYYSSILNLHLWLKENPFKERFYGLLDSRIHWIFSNGRHISLTTSSADEIIGLENCEIKRQLCSEMEEYFSYFNSEMVIDWKIIKEKRATFIPDIESTQNRKKINCLIDNLIIAGDWINTGLPGTIESAVMSGRVASEKVLSFLK